MWTDISGGLNITPAPGQCHSPAMCCLVSGVTRPGGRGWAGTQRDQSEQGNQGKVGEFLGTVRLEVFGGAPLCLIPSQGKGN